MADTHLAEVHSVAGTLYAIIVSTTGEAVPHRFYIGRNCGCCPIRITVVGGYAAKMLELIIFIFN